MANRPTAQTFNNDVALLWLLKSSKTVYRSILAQAQADKSGTGLSTVPELQAEYNELKTLIFDTAETLDGTIDQLELALRTDLVAQSEFGSYKTTTDLAITANADAISEEATKVTALQTADAEYAEFMKGQIVRGYITNPDYTAGVPDAPQYLYGIVISSQTSVTATKKSDFGDGQEYYAIDESSDPTFGFYTSTGWQFWVGGTRMGWYESKDNRLHIENLEAEEDMKMGNWIMMDSNGFGIKYIGA